ncbi:LLM class flavin-dependent oxidoreductase [Corynebacterium terpenotabidum]|uniref:Flavin-dependent oxidoreductase n=1 Tax=Corynebacterium terpenotabidum Y-11 TaxID=1200352 RepID=S4XDN0_9CORY|nr:LLM class flavin-dependent oxidoreductase [Corynebacterium terpenotabidum]AGP29695.1 flavin-dependent oxidoreductase [Corynebacterium terpenotabidum Y-11]
MTEFGQAQVHLNLFASGCGHHSAAWRAADSAVDRIGDITWWEEMAGIAERGLLDAVFFPDGQAARTDALASGPTWFLEPMTTLAAIARATGHIGLISSVSSTFWSPFHAARVLASIDHISGGRAGLNLVTSQLDAEARNHGMDALPNHALRYARAGEFAETLKELWGSWPAESVVADRSGLYTDTTRMHAVNHHDRWFSVAGPLNIPSPPQKQPMIFQAGVSEPGRDLAASHADGVFSVSWDALGAKGFRNDVRARTHAAGRNPDNVLVMPGLVVYLGSTEEEARRHQQELNALLPVEAALRNLSTFIGQDVTDWDPDAEVPPLAPVAETANPSGRYALVRHITENTGVRGGSSRGEDDRRRPTVRELLGYLAAGGGHATVVGTPEQVADEILRWVDGGAADGFNIMPPSLPGDLTDFVDHVVPVLQARGRFRTSYEGTTLREHFAG